VVTCFLPHFAGDSLCIIWLTLVNSMRVKFLFPKRSCSWNNSYSACMHVFNCLLGVKVIMNVTLQTELTYIAKMQNLFLLFLTVAFMTMSDGWFILAKSRVVWKPQIIQECFRERRRCGRIL
jgi:hypothetical protein